MKNACKLVLIEVDVTIDVKTNHCLPPQKHQIGCFIFTFERKIIFFIKLVQSKFKFVIL